MKNETVDINSLAPDDLKEVLESYLDVYGYTIVPSRFRLDEIEFNEDEIDALTADELRELVANGIGEFGLEFAWRLASSAAASVHSYKGDFKTACAIWFEYERRGLIPENKRHPGYVIPTTSDFWEKIADAYNVKCFAEHKAARAKEKSEGEQDDDS